ncbi:phage baseplate assembly protein V [Selenomonadales bacterium OttesenSCG-928-I06]|nr:phage baseplate assembly protein V [Selenomonadales bacterium OttesenSCG-928-I06]
MATNNQFQNLIREGIVSSTDPSTCTVRVTFPDKDDLVSAPLPVLTRGSKNNKDYWMPDVGESVVCIFLPNNTNGNNDGFCIGTHYNSVDKPPVNSQDKRHIKFSDGTTIEYDRSTSTLKINCVGDVIINGSTVNIN